MSHCEIRPTPDAALSPATATAPPSSGARWLLAGVLGGLWIPLCWHLSHQWRSDSQYNFGWLVPPLAAYLAYRRWLSRSAPGKSGGRFAALALVIFAAAFAPLWLLEQPNPDWRLVSWNLAIVVVGFTLALCQFAGGWVWTRHFAIPICLILTAIPWPTFLETPIVQGLMRFVAGVTVECLNMSGTIAVQQGNLIEVGTGLLGVNEACSGVRSLQSSLMIAVFLGEFFALRGLQRCTLVAVGLTSALVGNVVRAFVLSLTAAHSGLAAIGRWHDPAGFTILTGSLLVTSLVAMALAGSSTDVASPLARPATPSISRPFLIGLALWIWAVLTGTEIWFRTSPPPGAPAWSFQAPPDGRRVEDLPVEAEAVAALQFDVNRSKTWTEPDGTRWLAYYFEWQPGPARSRILARMHRPDACMTSIGYHLDSRRGTLPFDVGGLQLPFESYSLRLGQHRVYAYHCIWENRSSGALATSIHEPIATAGVQAVLRRERNLGQQALELILHGYETEAQADEALRRRLPDLIQPLRN